MCRTSSASCPSSTACGDMSEEEANAYSVRVELQADCYAGIWANYVNQENLLDQGDVDEAINAAEQIGDDTLQKRMQGFAVPKTFNHGTSAQRATWFQRGAQSGDVGQCDTFAVAIPSHAAREYSRACARALRGRRDVSQQPLAAAALSRGDRAGGSDARGD